jgi:hypothetical protein
MADEQRKQGILRWAYRFAVGRPMHGRPGYPYAKPGQGRLAGWQRQAWRVSLLGVAWLLFWHPGSLAYAVGAMAALCMVRPGREVLIRHRFYREYLAPTLEAMAPALGLDGGVTLHVDATLGNLTPRLAKAPSPAEQRVRLVYGQRIEPVLLWFPDRLQRLLWALQHRARPVTSRVTEAVRRPGEQLGPRIELQVRTPYLTREQRQLVSSIIGSKIPVGDLVESWHQVGPRVKATWTVRKRPPASVTHEHLLEHLPRLQEWEFYIGQGPADTPVVLSLKDDSPHIAVSAGSGAGKSVLAQLIAVQVLHRGGRVVILDRKGSHRWAIGVDGVDYCTKPAQMHSALIREAAEADERNDLALHEAEDWDPGPRTLVICEELNATIGQLTNYWAEVREKSDPKKSPAVAALADLLFMGRSAKKNVLAIAQMLTARAIGGPEARENFGVRCLARYTVNAWKMLVPEAAMPRSSRTLGRWQVVVGGVAVEVQVAYLTVRQARAVATPAKGLDEAVTSNVPGDGDMLTLRDAIDAGVLPWKYEATKKRLQRKVGNPPERIGQNGNADLYAREDLVAWAGRDRQNA